MLAVQCLFKLMECKTVNVQPPNSEFTPKKNAFAQAYILDTQSFSQKRKMFWASFSGFIFYILFANSSFLLDLRYPSSNWPTRRQRWRWTSALTWKLVSKQHALSRIMWRYFVHETGACHYSLIRVDEIRLGKVANKGNFFFFFLRFLNAEKGVFFQHRIFSTQDFLSQRGSNWSHFSLSTPLSTTLCLCATIRAGERCVLTARGDYGNV